MGRTTRRRGKRRSAGLDPLRLDVFHHLFAAAAEEMGASLLRSSFSTNVRERRDFSCAIFDGAGRMIGQASHLPVHLGSTPLSVAAAIADCPMDPGDAVILNDPFRGGTHLPDVTLVSPVFLPGSRTPDFFCANRAHHADVGGAHPGSMAKAADVHGEGLRIPPVRLVRGGAVDRDVLALVLANMRVPAEREGDLVAQWSANRIGAVRLAEMAAEHGRGEVRRRGAQLMDWTERLTRELLAGLPDGRWSFQDELEVPPDGGRPDERARVRVAVEKRGDELTCDFRGTDAASDSGLSAPRAVTMSAVFYVLRALLPRGTPANDGVLRPVTVLTRPGSLADAAYPCAVAAGNVETSQRLVDALLGALARAVPERVPAASAGTMSNFTFGGAWGGREYVYYETLGGGAGAGPEGDGAHAVQTHMTNTRNTPIEAFEAAYPVRVLRLDVRRGSGGRGRSRGGDGLEKRCLFLGRARVSWTAERQERGPWGLAGGERGEPGAARLAVPDRRGWRRLPGKLSAELAPGTVLALRTPGGGGYGAGGNRE